MDNNTKLSDWLSPAYLSPGATARATARSDRTTTAPGLLLPLVVHLARVLRVGPHDLRGAPLVAVGDRRDQLAVLDPGLLSARPGDRRVVPADPTVDLRRQLGEDRV